MPGVVVGSAGTAEHPGHRVLPQIPGQRPQSRQRGRAGPVQVIHADQNRRGRRPLGQVSPQLADPPHRGVRQPPLVALGGEPGERLAEGLPQLEQRYRLAQRVGRANREREPEPAARSTASPSRADLPMPGSPSTSSTPPVPRCARSSRSRTSRCSAPRPRTVFMKPPPVVRQKAIAFRLSISRFSLAHYSSLRQGTVDSINSWDLSNYLMGRHGKRRLLRPWTKYQHGLGGMELPCLRSHRLGVHAGPGCPRAGSRLQALGRSRPGCAASGSGRWG